MVIQIQAKSIELTVNGRSMGKFTHAFSIGAFTDFEVKGDIEVDKIDFNLRPATQDFLEAMEKFAPIFASLRDELRELRSYQLKNAATIGEFKVKLKGFEKRFDEKVMAFDPDEVERIHSKLREMHEKIDRFNRTSRVEDKRKALITLDEQDVIEIDAEDEMMIEIDSANKTECSNEVALHPHETTMNNFVTLVSFSLLLLLSNLLPSDAPEPRPMHHITI